MVKLQPSGASVSGSLTRRDVIGPVARSCRAASPALQQLHRTSAGKLALQPFNSESFPQGEDSGSERAEPTSGTSHQTLTTAAEVSE